ncbi:endonuclease domain-containing protein [Sphingomonas sp.]|uniref:endonuclease domain-containing protein n=1 Tax=Sphingomonas sp. TaxID=28214 RepID=UPI0025F2EE14|nr:endonuclease domain-containing protein [Sphingomonas sp.]
MLTGPGATIGKAKKLRQKMTLPEVILWRELRKRPGGIKFRRQHPAGPFVLDFACLESRLAIEIDGEVHSMGSRPAHDEARDIWLANQGFRTMRIAARDVLADLNAVLQFILGECKPLHHPSGGPPPRTGEEF